MVTATSIAAAVKYEDKHSTHIVVLHPGRAMRLADKKLNTVAVVSVAVVVVVVVAVVVVVVIDDDLPRA